MITEKARIISHKELAKGIYALSLECAASKETHPGQFVNVYLKNPAKLLPRPISICDAGNGAIRLVYRVTGDASGTAELSSYQVGDEVRITGPVGRGYPLSELKGAGRGDVVLMGGGIGVPPMLYLAKELLGHCTIVLGYRDSDTFLLEDFKNTKADILLASDDGSVGVHGTVMDAIEEAGVTPGVICACGPKPMLSAVKSFAKRTGAAAYISLEERMACGVGACLGCVTGTTGTDAHSHVKNARVCVDGPVFLADEVEI